MYAFGQMAAMRAFGVKLAFDMEDFASSLREQGIGHPQEAVKQFQKGTLFKPGKGLIHKNMPRGAGAIAASLAWPLMGTFLQAKNSPETSGAELAGDFLGRTTGSLLGSPFGAVGQIGGGMLLAPVGQAIGKAVGPRSPVVPEE